MTGLELLEAFSFVEERFIAEADTAKLGRNVPWMKVLSVAACLCILIVGAFALENMGHKSAEMEAAAPAAPAATEAMKEEAAPAETESGTPLAPESAAEESLTQDIAQAAGELHHIPGATLRIVSVADSYWVAVVEELPDEPVELTVGMELTVIVDTDGAAESELFGGILLPEEGLLAKIEDGAYDAGANILYVTGAMLEEPPEEG